MKYLFLAFILATITACNSPIQTPFPTQQEKSERTIQIVVPQDIDSYRKAVTEFVQVGGEDPLATWKFETKEITIKNSQDFIKSTAEEAAKTISIHGNQNPQIVYFVRKTNTLYLELDIQRDGWAGVSTVLAAVEPIIEKSLLRIPGIDIVIFGTAPNETLL